MEQWSDGLLEYWIDESPYKSSTPSHQSNSYFYQLGCFYHLEKIMTVL